MKPNLRELRALTALPLEDESDWPAAARGLVDAGNAEVVALSLAAMVWRLAAGGGLEEAFRYGIAGGTAALLAPGTTLAHKEDTERLAGQVELRRL